MREQPFVDLLASWSLHPPFRKHRLQHARLPNFCCYAPRLAEGTGIGPGPKSVGHGIMTPIANDFALLGNCPCLRPYFDPSSPSPAFASLLRAQAAEQGLCLAGGTYHSVSTVWFDDGNSTARSRVALDGVLFTRPLKRTEKTRWLGLQFQGLTMEVDGKPLSPRFFQVPFAVELDNATGAWLQTHFNGPLTLEDQEQVLALYGTLQGPDSTLIPPEGLTRLERDSIGSATVRYDSPALGTITRRKLAYETLRPGDEGQALTERVAVEQDETTLTELACGFRSADGRSSTEAFFRGGMTVKTLQRLAVAWDRTLAAPPGLRLAVLGEDPLAWPAVNLAWLYPPPPKTPLADAARFLAALSALDQDQIDDEALKALLFNNDRFLEALQDQFRAGAFSKAFQENLLLRIGQTDAPQARALLVTLAADEMLTPAARFGSLMALRYTPSKLEPESLEALMDFSTCLISPRTGSSSPIARSWCLGRSLEIRRTGRSPVASPRRSARPPAISAA
jgi:hypothetical protein